MARIWLHIGMMKTGTTAMQEWCRAQAPALAAQGLLYVHPPRRAASGHLVKALSGPHPGHRDAIAALARDLKDKAGDVLISAESLASQGPRFLRPLVDALTGHDIRILIWLRRQDRYAEAYYKQVVKWNGVKLDFAHCLRTLAAQLDYAAFLDQWQAAFPQVQLLPQVYEEPDAPAGAPDSIAAMLTAIGRSDLVPEGSATIRRNRTPHAGLVARYRQLGDTDPATLRNINRQIMREFGAAAGGRDDLIPPETASALLAQHAASNAATCARWFPGRPTLFADPRPAETSPEPQAALHRLETLLAEARNS